jgi:hypothetical protein
MRMTAGRAGPRVRVMGDDQVRHVARFEPDTLKPARLDLR